MAENLEYVQKEGQLVAGSAVITGRSGMGSSYKR